MLSLLLILSTCYLPPVPAPVAVGFVAPACRYCPGHRGNEYHLPVGTSVTAAAAGTVTFSGVVAGTRYLVVLHPDGISATYGMLRTAFARIGDQILTGQVVGASTDRLYFGLRTDDDTPIDPSELLAVATRRARLVPSNGSAGRPAVLRRPTCAAGAGTDRSSR
jgi:hypothetical protein